MIVCCASRAFLDAKSMMGAPCAHESRALNERTRFIVQPQVDARLRGAKDGRIRRAGGSGGPRPGLGPARAPSLAATRRKMRPLLGHFAIFPHRARATWHSPPPTHAAEAVSTPSPTAAARGAAAGANANMHVRTTATNTAVCLATRGTRTSLAAPSNSSRPLRVGTLDGRGALACADGALVAVAGRNLLRCVSLAECDLAMGHNLLAQTRKHINLSSNHVQWRPQHASQLARRALQPATCSSGTLARRRAAAHAVWQLACRQPAVLQPCRAVPAARRGARALCVCGMMGSASRRNSSPLRLSARCATCSSARSDLLCGGARAENGMLQLFDVRSNKQHLLQVQAHEGSVYCIQWHPDERGVLASGGRDRAVQVWDTSPAMPMPARHIDGRQERLGQVAGRAGRAGWPRQRRWRSLGSPRRRREREPPAHGLDARRGRSAQGSAGWQWASRAASLGGGGGKGGGRQAPRSHELRGGGGASRLT